MSLGSVQSLKLAAATFVVGTSFISGNDLAPVSEGGARIEGDIEFAETPGAGLQADIISDDYRAVVFVDDQPTEFGKKDANRFKQLAAKRALLEATPEETEEFAKLQSRRRKYSETVSGDQVLAEYQRRQMMMDAVRFLSKHVQFLDPEDQKKLWS